MLAQYLSANYFSDVNQKFRAVGQYCTCMFCTTAQFSPHHNASQTHAHRYRLPGIGGLNFLLEGALDGGGIASTRPDPLGKSFAQMLLDMEVEGISPPKA